MKKNLVASTQLIFDGTTIRSHLNVFPRDPGKSSCWDVTVGSSGAANCRNQSCQGSSTILKDPRVERQFFPPFGFLLLVAAITRWKRIKESRHRFLRSFQDIEWEMLLTLKGLKGLKGIPASIESWKIPTHPQKTLKMAPKILKNPQFPQLLRSWFVCVCVCVCVCVHPEKKKILRNFTDSLNYLKESWAILMLGKRGKGGGWRGKGCEWSNWPAAFLCRSGTGEAGRDPAGRIGISGSFQTPLQSAGE